jgi:hypothetical protein
MLASPVSDMPRLAPSGLPVRSGRAPRARWLVPSLAGRPGRIVRYGARGDALARTSSAASTVRFDPPRDYGSQSPGLPAFGIGGGPAGVISPAHTDRRPHDRSSLPNGPDRCSTPLAVALSARHRASRRTMLGDGPQWFVPLHATGVVGGEPRPVLRPSARTPQRARH